MKIYLLDWQNGMVGIFRGDNFEQVSNTSKEMLLWSLQHLMGVYKTDSFEISFLKSHEELNNKRREAGIGTKPTW